MFESDVAAKEADLLQAVFKKAALPCVEKPRIQNNLIQCDFHDYVAVPNGSRVGQSFRPSSI